MFNIVVVLCLIPVFEVFGGNSLPPYIKTCKRQPDLFPCLKENAELCRPNLAKGIPELYIPPLVPFVLPNVKLEHTGFTLDVKDLAIEGLQTFEMKRMDIKFESDFLMHAEIKLPTFLATGTYTIKGKLLMLELNGHGNGEANATDVLATVDITGTKVTKKGVEYVDIKDGTIVLTFGPIRIYFHNLFGDREDLTKATNEVIQENIMDFVKELKPVLEKVILAVVMGIVKPIFNKYSLDELFPK